MKKKWIVTISAASMMLGAGTGAFAGSNLQEIKAYFDKSLKMTVNGKAFQPTNDKGVPTLPIVYNGTTYLPVRAVSGALGVAVDYDTKTKTVSIGEKTEGTPIADGFEDMYRTKDPQMTTFNGKDYKDVYFNNATGNRSGSFMLYPKGKYQKLYLQVAAIGEDVEELVIKDSDKDIILKQESVTVADGLKTIVVDIGGVSELYIYGDLKGQGKLFVPLTTSYYK
ncbi:copper amine oxidase N-terminal domain-containing protein [Paenibacillus spongiae]|uniref:Copper amine oxidase N-terminal domain-containing protein n=1 Tax=Paenibacillus spongiae TaxID=2909671 RepID=A0ABY5SCZ4_9BACL|nr:copper amine oxidase N-terminal domain-containing protein [Paenibacillus spongiae]UVI30642.1 copper amine oxidase N-terminal domain-containing protein [Paenibacillus spongiae]